LLLLLLPANTISEIAEMMPLLSSLLMQHRYFGSNEVLENEGTDEHRYKRNRQVVVKACADGQRLHNCCSKGYDTKGANHSPALVNKSENVQVPHVPASHISIAVSFRFQ